MIVGYQPSSEARKIIKLIRTNRRQRKMAKSMKSNTAEDRAIAICSRGYYKTLKLIARAMA